MVFLNLLRQISGEQTASEFFKNVGFIKILRSELQLCLQRFVMKQTLIFRLFNNQVASQIQFEIECRKKILIGIPAYT